VTAAVRERQPRAYGRRWPGCCSAARAGAPAADVTLMVVGDCRRPSGGESGWCFPSISLSEKSVRPPAVRAAQKSDEMAEPPDSRSRHELQVAYPLPALWGMHDVTATIGSIAGQIGLLVLVGAVVGLVLAAIFWLPFRKLGASRMLRGDRYVAANVPIKLTSLEELDRATHLEFPMRGEEPGEGDLSNQAILNMGYAAKFFKRPVVKLYRSFLIVHYGPAMRAVVPYRNIAHVTALPPRTFRRVRDAVRYTPFGRHDAVLLELDPPTEMLKFKPLTRTALPP
jgi:hypothetical protein